MIKILPSKFYLTAFFLTIALSYSPCSQAQDNQAPKNVRDLISASLIDLGMSQLPVNIVTSLNSNDAQHNDLTNLYKEILPSMVRVVVSKSDADGLKKSFGSGSGVAITEDKILTNCHLLPSLDEMLGKTIYVQDFKKRTFVSKLSASDIKSDRCVLELNLKVLRPIKAIRHKDSVRVGELAYAVGSPKGFDNAFSAGHIAWISSAKANRKIFLSTVAIAKGSSGGGLFDQNGFLIGITTAFLTDSSQFSVIIPAHDYVSTFSK